jgi:hypothetical protein
MSCHATAQFPRTFELTPPSKLDENDPEDLQKMLRWFENRPGTRPFDDDGRHIALDYSLQMGFALTNFERAGGEVIE